jgi:hypothetical protein
LPTSMRFYKYAFARTLTRMLSTHGQVESTFDVTFIQVQDIPQ